MTGMRTLFGICFDIICDALDYQWSVLLTSGPMSLKASITVSTSGTTKSTCAQQLTAHVCQTRGSKARIGARLWSALWCLPACRKRATESLPLRTLCPSGLRRKSRLSELRLLQFVIFFDNLEIVRVGNSVMPTCRMEILYWLSLIARKGQKDFLQRGRLNALSLITFSCYLQLRNGQQVKGNQLTATLKDSSPAGIPQYWLTCNSASLISISVNPLRRPPRTCPVSSALLFKADSIPFKRI